MGYDWSIEYGPYITQQFEKLNETVVQTAIKRIGRLQKNPELGKPLKGKARNYNLRSLRISTSQGEFRVIYQLWEEHKKILAVFIGSREDVYDRLNRWLE